VTASLEDLARRILRAFPDLGTALPLAELGRGFRSVAYETPGGYVVKVGQSPDALTDYEKERRIGPWLAAQIGTLVPEPRWSAPPSEDLPFGAVAYRKLTGRPPRWGADPGHAFASDLGAFMAKLHALSIDDALGAGIPEVDTYKRMLGARAVVEPVLRARLTPRRFEQVETWWREFAADERMRTTRRVVCHHDLWHDNLLLSDRGRLAGVLDVAHVEVADPAHDFAAPRYFGDAFMRTLLAAYREAGREFDEHMAHRAQRYWEGREFGGLAWAIEHDDAAEVCATLGKIEHGPVFESTCGG
jgi:macrolide phosphotransferase